MLLYEELSLMNGKCQASEKRVKSLTTLISAANWHRCKLFLTGPLPPGYAYAKRHVGNVVYKITNPIQFTVM